MSEKMAEHVGDLTGVQAFGHCEAVRVTARRGQGPEGVSLEMYIGGQWVTCEPASCLVSAQANGVVEVALEFYRERMGRAGLIERCGFSSERPRPANVVHVAHCAAPKPASE